MRNLKLIKFAVFIMTFLLVFMTLMIGHRFLKKTAEAENYSDINLSEPDGTEIKSVSVVNDNLYILVHNNNQSDHIIVYNPEKRKKLFNININNNN